MLAHRKPSTTCKFRWQFAGLWVCALDNRRADRPHDLQFEDFPALVGLGNVYARVVSAHRDWDSYGSERRAAVGQQWAEGKRDSL